MWSYYTFASDVFKLIFFNEIIQKLFSHISADFKRRPVMYRSSFDFNSSNG